MDAADLDPEFGRDSRYLRFLGLVPLLFTFKAEASQVQNDRRLPFLSPDKARCVCHHDSQGFKETVPVKKTVTGKSDKFEL